MWFPSLTPERAIGFARSRHGALGILGFRFLLSSGAQPALRGLQLIGVGEARLTLVRRSASGFGRVGAGGRVLAAFFRLFARRFAIADADGVSSFCHEPAPSQAVSADLVPVY
jgi:hypothetical protein